MSLEKIKNTVAQIIARVPAVRGRGEEATKQALILPMLDALGYDIWNPAEVCPEYEADFATKKAGQKEKVDMAIILGGLPRIYFEVKAADTPLDGHHGQLMLALGEPREVLLIDGCLQAPFRGKLAVPLAADLVAFGVVIHVWLVSGERSARHSTKLIHFGGS
jgi:hypothetical protein